MAHGVEDLEAVALLAPCMSAFQASTCPRPWTLAWDDTHVAVEQRRGAALELSWRGTECQGCPKKRRVEALPAGRVRQPQH